MTVPAKMIALRRIHDAMRLGLDVPQLTAAATANAQDFGVQWDSCPVCGTGMDFKVEKRKNGTMLALRLLCVTDGCKRFVARVRCGR